MIEHGGEADRSSRRVLSALLGLAVVVCVSVGCDDRGAVARTSGSVASTKVRISSTQSLAPKSKDAREVLAAFQKLVVAADSRDPRIICKALAPWQRPDSDQSSYAVPRPETPAGCVSYWSNKFEGMTAVLNGDDKRTCELMIGKWFPMSTCLAWVKEERPKELKAWPDTFMDLDHLIASSASSSRNILGFSRAVVTSVKFYPSPPLGDGTRYPDSLSGPRGSRFALVRFTHDYGFAVPAGLSHFVSAQYARVKGRWLLDDVGIRPARG